MSQKQVQAPKDDEGEVMGKYLTSFQRKLLQKNLQQDLSDKQRQRIQIMLLADRGKTQVEICRKLGCCQATARYWITMARTNQAHHWRSNPIGRPTLVHEEYLQRLKQLVTKSPQEVNVPNKDYQYPFRRWTAQKLSQHLYAELEIKITPQHLNRLLKQMGLSTRPKPDAETERDWETGTPHSSPQGIQIGNLDTVSIFDGEEELVFSKNLYVQQTTSAISVDTPEIWTFNPLTSK